MIDDLPQPLISPEVDIAGLTWFSLNVDRLLASELVALATPEEAWAAMMLWCRAWQQKPAGSLPNDERVLAAFSRAGSRWKKVRAMALRGFVLCSDGRLYHPVVCEQVMDGWAKRLRYRDAQKRLRKWRATQKGNAAETPPETYDETHFNDVSETHHEIHPEAQPECVDRTGPDQERKKEPQKKSKENLPTPTDRHAEPSGPLASLAVRSQDSAEFQQFWQKYPRREGKGAARKSFEKARKSASFEAIIAALDRPWAADPRFVPHPATWLNQQRWLDEPPERGAQPENSRNPPYRNGFAALGARLAEQARAAPSSSPLPSLLTTENLDETTT